MLAYLFWHRPYATTTVKQYEEALLRFQQHLGQQHARSPQSCICLIGSRARRGRCGWIASNPWWQKGPELLGPFRISKE
jgi:hypothetical protein